MTIRISLPPGLPGWIDPELFALTKETLEEKYNIPLTADDIADILLNTGRLLDVLN